MLLHTLPKLRVGYSYAWGTATRGVQGSEKLEVSKKEKRNEAAAERGFGEGLVLV